MKNFPIKRHPDLLYNRLISEFGKHWIDEIELSKNTFHNNINKNFELRNYQEKALKMFVGYFRKDFSFRERPAHLLFNMATGSGKTLIMACCILHLYKLGYRNFLFFSTSNPIIEKTKDNFLKTLSEKYLFSKSIELNGKSVKIREIENFEEANEDDINIKFTTIHKLHGDLRIPKENSVTFDSLRDLKLVLVGDEAHHFNTATNSQMSFDDILKDDTNWESTITKILSCNSENILLEYTATIDWHNPKIAEKYLPKCLMMYDLKEFRENKYSKEIKLFQYDEGIEKKDLMLNAVILNQFKQDVATKYNINLKPVILFKANRTIEESKENFNLFQKIIRELSISDLERLKTALFKNQKKGYDEHGDYIDNNYLIAAFKCYEKEGFGNLIRKLKINFDESKCLNVNEYVFDGKKQSLKNFENNKSEATSQENILNSLESLNNGYRAIFAVNKLNEGWDVLNLFDIVRLYNTRDSRNNRSGSTTTAEAQLIGRGARYFPFSFDNKDKYKRKFDDDVTSPLRLLETLHYHSVYNSRYISELRSELIQSGLIDESKKLVNLKLKRCFRDSKIYQHGVVYSNTREPTNYRNTHIWDDINKQFEYTLYSGLTEEKALLNESKESDIIPKEKFSLKLLDVPKNIKLDALLYTSFFEFNNLKRYITDIKSIDDFVDNYIDTLEITLKVAKDLTEISQEDQFQAVRSLFMDIRDQLKDLITPFKGTRKFKPIQMSSVFKDKELHLEDNNPRLANNMKDYVKNKNWYVYDSVYGTEEEKNFIEMFETIIPKLKEKYTDVKLIRNERALPIFDFKQGRRFEPDFILLLKDKDDNSLNYQFFIEPKGSHIQKFDQWKEDFLLQIKRLFRDTLIEYDINRKYKLIGLSFYSKRNEQKFKRELIDALSSSQETRNNKF